MSLTTAQRAEATWLLRMAEHPLNPIDPLPVLLPGLDLTDAYAVQRDNIARRLADGATVIGHKGGLTSFAMQELIGVAEPDFAHLLDPMVYRDGSPALAARYTAPRIEPGDLLPAGPAPARSRRQRRGRPRGQRGGRARPGDRRQPHPRPEAHPGRHGRRQRQLRYPLRAGLVCGPWTPLEYAPDLATVTADLHVNGEQVASGSGKEVLGHPAAVAWLANTLAAFATALKPGHVVLPGAASRALRVGGRRWDEARLDRVVKAEQRGAGVLGGVVRSRPGHARDFPQFRKSPPQAPFHFGCQLVRSQNRARARHAPGDRRSRTPH